MITPAFIAAVTPALNLNNAREYAAQTDRYLWVEYHILDSVHQAPTNERVNWVEDRFEEILAAQR
jgi:hypothetical protein